RAGRAACGSSRPAAESRGEVPSMRRRGVCVAAALMLCVALSSRAAAEEAAVTEPAEGSVVGRRFMVAGTLPDGATDVLVNGRDAVVKDRTFALEVIPLREGPLLVRVVMG